ncbi:hypothetical protein D8S78_24730 [Natrialba swarupiae]|nr:hypothetical protein [Natrialba swarupiae]
MDPTTAEDGVNGLAAVIGGFVATQAYRGYRRYNSRPMLLLAAGVLLLTVGSFVGAIMVDTFSEASDGCWPWWGYRTHRPRLDPPVANSGLTRRVYCLLC